MCFFCRRLCSQIPEEWLQRSSPESDLLDLVTEICQYCLKYSAEAEACDLLMEIEKIRMIYDLVTEDISDRVCLYLTRLAWPASVYIPYFSTQKVNYDNALIFRGKISPFQLCTYYCSFAT